MIHVKQRLTLVRFGGDSRETSARFPAWFHVKQRHRAFGLDLEAV